MQKLENNIKMQIVRHQKRRTERRPHVSHAMSTCQPLTDTSKRTLTGVYCNTYMCVL